MARRGGGIKISFFAFQDIITAVVGIFLLITLLMVLQLAESTSSQSANSQSAKLQGNIEQQVLDTLDDVRTEVTELRRQYEAAMAADSSGSAMLALGIPQSDAELDEALNSAQRQFEAIGMTLDKSKQSLAGSQAILEQDLANSKARDPERQELKRIRQRTTDLGQMLARIESDQPMIYRNTTATGENLVLVELAGDKIQLSASDGGRRTFNTGDSLTAFRSFLLSRNLANDHFLVVTKPSGSASFESVSRLLTRMQASFGIDLALEDAQFSLDSEFESN